MANHKSAKKRIRTSERKRVVNKRVDSEIKTAVRKALNTTDKSEAEKVYKSAISTLDRQAAKGKIHKNTAARKKAALTKHFNETQSAE